MGPRVCYRKWLFLQALLGHAHFSLNPCSAMFTFSHYPAELLITLARQLRLFVTFFIAYKTFIHIYV